MDKRGKIAGAIFLLMFGFGIASLAFQFALDSLSPGHVSDAAYAVFGTLATAGASGYASLFYFLVRNSPPPSAAPDPHPSPPPYDREVESQIQAAEDSDEWGPGYHYMRGRQP
jgi:hypothetical protein